jgi:hypothetical protein
VVDDEEYAGNGMMRTFIIRFESCEGDVIHPTCVYSHLSIARSHISISEEEEA